MLTAVAYPVPMETPEVWETFKPDVERFARSWRENPPGAECSLYIITCGANVNSKVAQLFVGIRTPLGFVRYDGGGCDIGAHLYLASRYLRRFQVNFTTRMIIHRAGWLKRLVDARKAYGPALYGMSASYEGGKLHLCTRGHALDTTDFANYPHTIDTREKGKFFENGDGCLMTWASDVGLPTYIVSWTGVHSLAEYFSLPGRFRNGDQSNMLVWDRHTEIYRNAGPEEKARLTELAESQKI